MPVHVEKRGKIFRVVESSRRIAKNKAGTALDGGGHLTKLRAQQQAKAVNANL